MDKTQPLWLPKGSVRAIIAISLVVATLLLIAASVLRSDGDIPPALAALVGMAGFVIQAYFNKAEQPPEPPTDG